MYNIKSFNPLPGAFPDYTDVIQAFENQLYDEGGGFLIMPRGGYGLRIINGVWAIKKRPGVSWVGEGQGRTIVKLLDNQGNYETIVGHDANESIDNIEISGITFDQNRQNNPVTYADGAAWIAAHKGRHVFRFMKGKRLSISDCRFMNCDNINTIATFAGNTTGIIENVRITDNEFDAGGSPFDHDHSTIYIEGERAILRNNFFIASSPNGARAAFDLHHTSIIQDGNIVEGYQIGSNVVSNKTMIVNNIMGVPQPIRTGYLATLEQLVYSNNI